MKGNIYECDFYDTDTERKIGRGSNCKMKKISN